MPPDSLQKSALPPSVRKGCAFPSAFYFGSGYARGVASSPRMRIGKAEPFRTEGGKAAPSLPGLFRAANPAGYIEASAINSFARLIL